MLHITSLLIFIQIGYSESRLLNLAYSNSENDTSPEVSGSGVNVSTFTKHCAADAAGMCSILSYASLHELIAVVLVFP